MKLYEFIIKPRSPFGTPLKGDTLFGHFCWQARYEGSLLNGGLEQWIAGYVGKPFIVFSSAWPRLKNDKGYAYAIKRPDVPLNWLFAPTGCRKDDMRERKKKAGRKWLLVPENLMISLEESNIINDAELIRLIGKDWTETLRRTLRGRERNHIKISHLQAHNTINRRTMTTGRGMFAPYSAPTFFYWPGMELALFVVIDEEATDAERVGTALKRIGRNGFGRDASSGLGRFDVELGKEKIMPLPEKAEACYALGPVVPEKDVYAHYYFTPFTRFGKHGDVLATSPNPFKCPVVMADEGAVLIPKAKEALRKPYIGRAIQNISKSEPRAVAQGYAPFIPFKLEQKT